MKSSILFPLRFSIGTADYTDFADFDFVLLFCVGYFIMDYLSYQRFIYLAGIKYGYIEG